jgi:hypothetical protein
MDLHLREPRGAGRFAHIDNCRCCKWRLKLEDRLRQRRPVKPDDVIVVILGDNGSDTWRRFRDVMGRQVLMRHSRRMIVMPVMYMCWGDAPGERQHRRDEQTGGQTLDRAQ